MIKSGINYQSDKGYTIALYNSYFSEPTQVNEIVSTSAEVNPPAEDYNLLTANININANKVFGLAGWPDTTLSLYGDNLLDEDIFFPDFNRQKTNSLPHHAGIGFYATATIRF